MKLVSRTSLTMDSPTLQAINITNQLIAKEALGRGFKVDFLPTGIATTGLLIIDTGDVAGEVLLKSSVSHATAGYGIIIARNKYLAAEVMQYYAIPTPETVLFESMDSAEQFLKQHRAIVVKPLDTSHGTGITLKVQTSDQLEQAVKKAQRASSKIILQATVEGTDHRLLIVGGKLIAASKRLPAYVVGNGTSNLEELIDQENRNPKRGAFHTKPMTFINKQKAIQYLSSQGKQLTDIPPKGAQIAVVATANLSTGGEAHDITDQVHPKIAAMAVKAADISGLAVCGVDVITKDVSADPDDIPAYILELNEAPGIRMHHFPAQGQPRNVASAILDLAINYKLARNQV